MRPKRIVCVLRDMYTDFRFCYYMCKYKRACKRLDDDNLKDKYNNKTKQTDAMDLTNDIEAISEILKHIISIEGKLNEIRGKKVLQPDQVERGLYLKDGNSYVVVIEPYLSCILDKVETVRYAIIRRSPILPYIHITEDAVDTFIRKMRGWTITDRKDVCDTLNLVRMVFDNIIL